MPFILAGNLAVAAIVFLALAVLCVWLWLRLDWVGGLRLAVVWLALMVDAAAIAAVSLLLGMLRNFFM